MLKGLRSQLTLSILLLLLLTILLASVFGGWFINREFENYIARQEDMRTENILRDLGTQYNPLTRSWDENFLHTIGMYSLYDGYLLKVYDEKGNMLWDAENHDMTLCNQIMEDISSRMAGAKKEGGFSAHIYDITQGDKKVGSVSVTNYAPYFFSENDFQFINTLNAVLIATGILAALLAIILGSVLAHRIARPITEAADTATEIAKGNYDIHLNNRSHTRELNELVTAINHLSKTLGEQEARGKQLTTDVAHELRTPLTAISAHLEAMISGLWEPTPKRLSACYEEVGRLSHLINDLQRLSQIEGENLKLHRTPEDLLKIAALATETMEGEALKKKLTLTVKGEPSLIEVDRERILQVVINLLSNAIKYTGEGGHITLEILDTPEESILQVTDDGIGIPQEEIPLIFERFYRTDKSRSRKTGGAGIGLTIVKSIVSAHGGTITAESEVDKGSTFTVILPKNNL